MKAQPWILSGLLATVGLLGLACPHPIAPETVARCAAGIALAPDVTPPKITYQKIPKAGHIPGTELFSCLEITVNVDGTVSDITVVEPHDAKFDSAVIEAVKEWRYIPARKNGQPIATRRRVVVYNYRPPVF